MSSIWASLTEADPGRLTEVALRLAESGVDGLHIDVADGMFVPEIGFSHRVVAALTSAVDIPVEAHLMVCTPEEQLRAVAAAGAHRVSFHLESSRYPARLADLARNLGVTAGMAINPATPLRELGYLYERLDFVNILTTEPDLTGERMLPDMAERVRLAIRVFGPGVSIEVDGGISAANIAELAAAGAGSFVVGRALLGDPNGVATVSGLRARISQSSTGTSTAV